MARGDAEDMDMAGADLDDEEHVQAAQGDGAVHVEEVACKRSNVSGVTIRLVRNDLGSSRARPPSTAQSARSSLGLGFCRRSTAISWRSTSNSRVLPRSRACQQHHPPGQTDEHRMQHPYCHKPPMLPATQPLPRQTSRSATYTRFGTLRIHAAPPARRHDGQRKGPRPRPASRHQARPPPRARQPPRIPQHHITHRQPPDLCRPRTVTTALASTFTLPSA